MSGDEHQAEKPDDNDLELRPLDGVSVEQTQTSEERSKKPDTPSPRPWQFSTLDLFGIILALALGFAGGTWMADRTYVLLLGLVVCLAIFVWPVLQQFDVALLDEDVQRKVIAVLLIAYGASIVAVMIRG
jgi:hypothetical protein